ncbi:MAG: DUF2254 domain-containing protein [Bacillota bacterium]|nr:DUF2254 domain-containing protein [Bacillota bacterium]
MKKMINKFKTSIWLYPTIYSLFSLALSLIITIIDKLYARQIADYIHDIFYTTTSLAQTVLGIVAGAFITIVTFTFSTTMIVLTMYSSQFTPRVIENFLNNKITMKSFGVFLSGFIFAIISLLFINTNDDGNLVIAASVGVIYVIIGLIYFLVFIHNVSTHIQASDLILRLQEEALRTINEYCNFVKQSDIISEEKMNEIIDNKLFTDVLGQSDGYIQEINYPKLKKIAQDHSCIVCFTKVVGQFISTETKILTVYYEDPEINDEAVIHEIQQCILIGNKKTEAQDFSFTIQKIVEIALKALSPGINDPNTATHCLNIIGVLIRNLADIEKGYVVLKEASEQGFIIYEAFDFELLLYDAYNQIMFYGRSDATVMIAGFKSLRFIKAKASKDNIKIIDEYAKYLIDQLAGFGYGELEYRKINNEYIDMANYMNEGIIFKCGYRVNSV